MKSPLTSPQLSLCPQCRRKSTRKRRRAHTLPTMEIDESARRLHDLVQDLRRDFRYDPTVGEPA